MEIPGYRITGVIGRGGSAEALSAVDRAGQRAVIKLFHAAGDARAEREAAALARLGAPLAPALYRAGRLADGRPFLAMEEVIGEPPARVQAIDWIAAAAATVDAMHDAGVVHRDLKPPHLLRRPGGAVTALDFALARLVGEPADAAIAPHLTRFGERLGTAAYMAPEQCRGEADIGPAADLYALGVIAFELLTGRRPFSGSAAEIRAAHASARPPVPSALAGQLPAAVDAVIARALAKDPAARHPCAGDFAHALAEALRAGPGEVRAASAAPATSWREVAVLVFASPAAVGEIERAVGAPVAHVDGARAVVAFAGATLSGAVESACRTARELTGRIAVDGPVVVSVAEVRPGRGGRPRLRTGDALLAELAAAPEDVEVALVPAAADAIARHGLRPLAGGWAALIEAAALAEPDLVDREAILAALADHAAGGAGIATVSAEAGLGKTRLLGELAGRMPGAWWLRPDEGHGALAALVERARSELGGDLVDLLPAPEAAALAAALGLARETGGTPAETRKRAAAAAALLVRRARPPAILLDDAHRADTIALDALEALGESDVWVCVTARAGLRDARPGWAASARALELELAALSDRGSAALLRQLVGAEFVPDAVIDRLRGAAAGVPLLLVELARALRAGALRAAGDAPGLTIAADHLAHLSTVPIAERNARAELDALSEPLRRLAVLCAVLGDQVRPAELDAAQRRIGGDWIDPGVGVRRLVAAGILIPAGNTVRFRHPVARAAIEGAAPAGEAAGFHRAQLALVEEAGDLARIAIHAAGAGEPVRAGRAHLELAEAARSRHAYVDAELEYSAALARLDGDQDRMRALAGRASVRYQIHRLDEALADATAARQLAEALDDRRKTVELLLLEAMILDWKFAIDEAEDRTHRARALGRDLDDLEPALLAAEGRLACRREDLAGCADLLGRAATLGDYQTRITSIVLLAPILAILGRTDESMEWFERVIELCTDVGDDLHLAIALANRTPLWARLERPDRAREDLGRAVVLAHRLGNAVVERSASFNLAELLYHDGALEESLPLALRARDLQRRFVGEDELPDCALLLARVHAARGEREAARTELDQVREKEGLAPTARVLVRLLELVLAPTTTSAEWEDLEAAVRQLDSTDVLLEYRRFAGKR
jgi:eukaryotic-like serine/threonine-protein kinase